jgi:hypothetical protein
MLTLNLFDCGLNLINQRSHLTRATVVGVSVAKSKDCPVEKERAFARPNP